MLEVPGRVFVSEKIQFKNKVAQVDPLTEEWSALCKSCQVISSIPLENWILVYTNRNVKLAQEFAPNIAKAGSQIGFKIGKPEMLELRDDRRNSFVDSIKKSITDTTQFIAFVLPTPQGDRYDGIKQTCW